MRTPLIINSKPTSSCRQKCTQCLSSFFYSKQKADIQDPSIIGYNPPAENESNTSRSRSSSLQHDLTELTRIKNAFLAKNHLTEIAFNAEKKSLVCTMEDDRNGGILLKYQVNINTDQLKSLRKTHFSQDPIQRERQILTWLMKGHTKSHPESPRHFPAIINNRDLPYLPHTEITGLPIAMEYIHGDSLPDFLQQLLENPNTDLTTYIQLIKKIIDAMSQIHEYGIMHLDLNPDNLIVTDANTVCIIDYETASHKTEHLRSRSVRNNTPGFSPNRSRPANNNKQPQSNRSDDLFALCSNILYILHTSLPHHSHFRLNLQFMGNKEHRETTMIRLYNSLLERFNLKDDPKTSRLLSTLLNHIQLIMNHSESSPQIESSDTLNALGDILTAMGAFESASQATQLVSITGSAKQ